MATESVVKNIRAPQTVFDKLKALTDEQFPNQGAALEALVNLWEVQAAKSAIPSRETDITDFDSHVQALQRAFIHSLEVAQNADARARDAFRQKLEALEAEKTDLRQRLETAEAEKRTAQHKKENATNSAIDANARADTAERHAATLEKALEAEKASTAAAVADKEKLIHSLTAQIADLSERGRQDAAAVADKEKLTEEAEKLKRELNAAQTAAEIAAAKALAAQAEAVAAVRAETSTQLLKLTEENAALRVELERAKARITLLESPHDTQKTANAAPMSDQRTPPPPAKDTSNAAQRQKAAPKSRKNKPNAAEVTEGAEGELT